LENYEFEKNLKVIDLTKELEYIDKTYEFVFTQAVVMHLSYDRAKKFLFNMKKLSNKYIFLIENQNNHNFAALKNFDKPAIFKMVSHLPCWCRKKHKRQNKDSRYDGTHKGR
jgi:hypothetical protein